VWLFEISAYKPNSEDSKKRLNNNFKNIAETPDRIKKQIYVTWIKNIGIQPVNDVLQFEIYKKKLFYIAYFTFDYKKKCWI